MDSSEIRHRPTVARNWVVGVKLGLAVFLTASCGDEPSTSTTPPLAPASIAWTNPPAATDTVDAEPATTYAVRLLDEGASPVPGVSVTFFGDNVAVGLPGGAFAASQNATTDAMGTAAVVLRFGTVSGVGSVRATVAGGLADTLLVTVQPGARNSAALIPGDTSVVLGSEFMPRAVGLDRHGNETDTAAVMVESGPLTRSGDRLVADSLGEAVLRAVVGTDTVSADVRIVPDGELLVIGSGVARLVRFDGSLYDTLSFTVPSVQEPSADWSPNGERFVVGGHDGFRVFELDTETTTPATWPGGAAGSNVIWPRFSSDGLAIIYSQGGGGWDLRQAALDATGASVVIAAGTYSGEDLMPDWAPDGSRFVFTSDWEQDSRFLLRISDPGATSIGTLSVEGVTPAWSPDGALIAYQELGVVGVISPDGVTTDESWAPGWSKGVSWSPESDLLAGLAGGVVAVIDISTGAAFEYPELGSGLSAVAWRPTGAAVTPPPAPSATVTVTSGPAVTDTVDAEPMIPVEVLAVSAAGDPFAGAVITAEGENLLVATAGGGTYLPEASETTDADGRATVLVKFGTSAGAARLLVRVGVGPAADSLDFTITAGAAETSALIPSDTTVAIGLPFDAETWSVDRHGNSIAPNGGGIAIESGPLLYAGGPSLVGDSIGNAVIYAVFGVDTLRSAIRVVPDGSFVYTRGGMAVVARFDGTEVDTLSFSVPGARERSVDWSPDGDRIVVGGSDGFRVFDVNSEVVTPSVWPDGLAGSDVIWPRFAPDGSSVLYSQGSGGWDLRRAAPDATGASVVIAAGTHGGEDLMPAWAPDGSSFVFTADWEVNSQFFLRISDAAVTSVSTIAIEGVTPVWSPDGALIAYQELGVVGVVSPDGVTIDRSWNPGWNKGITWSPGANMLVGLDGGDRIEVIDVLSGRTIAFPEFGSGIDAVGWRPN